MQELNEGRMTSLKTIGEAYVSLEQETLAKTQKHFETILTTLAAIDPPADSQLFVAYHQEQWKPPMEAAFEPSLLWKDTVRIYYGFHLF
jgi:hypothetical protein